VRIRRRLYPLTGAHGSTAASIETAVDSRASATEAFVQRRHASMTLRHVVLFGFGKDQSPAAIAEVIRRFVELKELVPGIDDFEWGENSSPEGLDRGHSHAFLLTFANSQARDAYLVHPDHVAFGNWVQSFVSSVTVLDYSVKSKATGVL
jgi:Stress responsive A/B Barrel Domain